jgi:ABC-type phosphate/phosphonate transport system substrate-binding protein
MKRRRASKWRGYGLAAAWLAGAALPLPCAAAGGERTADGVGLRIAVSESVTGEMNANDAGVALRAWADEIARQTGMRFEPELCNYAQLVQKMRNHQVDAFSANVLEYTRVAAYAGRELVVDESQLPDGEEYVLLVHQSSGIQSLADLRGRSMLLYQQTRMCLDRIWLDTLMAAAHLGPMETSLGRVESSPKLSRVVLPVFFRQIDACVVARQGFKTMCELNPQLAKQLRELAVSPKLLTTFMAFHKDCPPETRRRFLAAVADLHKTVAGRQVLTLFGGSHLVEADSSLLGASLELMHAYERLKGRTAAAGQ